MEKSANKFVDKVVEGAALFIGHMIYVPAQIIVLTTKAAEKMRSSGGIGAEIDCIPPGYTGWYIMKRTFMQMVLDFKSF